MGSGHERGLWVADEEALRGLREAYLAIEGDLEAELGEGTGRLQGGGIDVITSDEIAGWREAMEQAGVHTRNRKPAG